MVGKNVTLAGGVIAVTVGDDIFCRRFRDQYTKGMSLCTRC